jgi:sorbitol-specific phosphotransferase system component IIBC
MGAERTQVEQQMITSAYVDIRVSNVSESLDELKAAISEYDGTIANEALTQYDGDQQATLTARIPQANLSAFLEDIDAVGQVENRSINSTDVTMQVVDVQARLDALEASITRLRALQAQADTVADLVAIEAELANRQAERDSLASQLEYLSDQVAMSTVSFTLLPEVSVGVAEPDFIRGLSNGWNALLGLGAGLITAIGFAVPFLIVAAVIGAVIGVILGARRRRKAANRD